MNKRRYMLFCLMQVMCCSSQGVVLMPYVFDANTVCGIGNFNLIWQQLFEQLPLGRLQHNYEIKDIVRAKSLHPVLRKVYKGDVIAIDSVPKKRTILIVHGVNKHLLKEIRQADYLVYLNPFFKEIVENIAGIQKPCCVMDSHPIPFHLVRMHHGSRKQAVYVGGHFVPDKYQGIIDILMWLVEHLDTEPATQGMPIDCYFALPREQLKDQFFAFKNQVALHPILSCRVSILQEGNHFTYEEMLENMQRYTHAFLWRDSLSLVQFKEMLARKDPALLHEKIGESGMLAAAAAAGCTLIVQEVARFISYFETDMSFSFESFVQRLADFVKAIDAVA